MTVGCPAALKRSAIASDQFEGNIPNVSILFNSILQFGKGS